MAPHQRTHIYTQPVCMRRGPAGGFCEMAAVTQELIYFARRAFPLDIWPASERAGRRVKRRICICTNYMVGCSRRRIIWWAARCVCVCAALKIFARALTLLRSREVFTQSSEEQSCFVAVREAGWHPPTHIYVYTHLLFNLRPVQPVVRWARADFPPPAATTTTAAAGINF
jgi:hypothetical protein